ncbi:MAG: type II toxin-antitoxin system HicB family antitoxin [Anaerovoracaceae bacterium]
MKKSDRYFYPAIFTYEPGQEIAVVFPDLDCATSGVDNNDAFLSARELLGCVMFGLEEDEEEIPAPTPISEITVFAGGFEIAAE